MVTEDKDQMPPPEVLAELRVVIARAKDGDASALPALRATLDRFPKLAEHYGDLARQAEGAWISLAAGPNLYLRESLGRTVAAQRSELIRPGASLVEKLLAERVLACQLEVTYFSASEANLLAAGDTPKQLQFRAKRLAQAQKMLLAAVSALTVYQKLMPAGVEHEAARAGLPVPAKQHEQVPSGTAEATQRLPQLSLTEEPTPAEAESEEVERLRIRQQG
jgi:hypothetical protein